MFGRDEFYMYREMENEIKTSKIPEPINLEEKNIDFNEYVNMDMDYKMDNNYFNDNNNAFDDNELNDNDMKFVISNEQNILNNDERNNWSEEDLESEIQFNNNNDKRYINDITSAVIHNNNNNKINNSYNNNNVSHLKTKNGYEFVNVNDLINEIGFGKFHYQLIFLCGLGYIADSMWSSSISLIINPVQNEFGVPNMYIGWLASTLFLGMCIGSFFWGRISDIIGRKFPFALTLCIAGIYTKIYPYIMCLYNILRNIYFF